MPQSASQYALAFVPDLPHIGHNPCDEPSVARAFESGGPPSRVCWRVTLMPDHSAVAIANEFLRRRSDEAWPKQMLIQKLSYIAHGWNLAINNQPLISEAPQAWDNGPVYGSIWDHIRDYGYRGPHCTLVNPFTKEVIIDNLTIKETAIVDHVWKKYGQMSANALSDMTHQPDTPWSKAYFGRGRNAPLYNDEIKEHYIRLGLAGRAGAAN